LAGLHFVSEKNEDKNIEVCTMNATKPNKSISVKKDTGECSSTKLKSTWKNSGTFEGNKIYPKKSLTSLLHQAIQLYPVYTATQKQVTVCPLLRCHSI